MKSSKAHPLPKSFADLKPARYNPREITPAAAKGLAVSLDRFGDLGGITWNRKTGHLVTGHQRVQQLKKLGATVATAGAEPRITLIHEGRTHFFDVRVVDWTLEEEKAANVVANSQAIAGSFTREIGSLLDSIKTDFGDDLFKALLLDELIPPPLLERSLGSLRARFLFPPFSVLDARSGEWQERKRAWLSLGIRSEVGRGENLLKFSEKVMLKKAKPLTWDTASSDETSQKIKQAGPGTLRAGISDEERAVSAGGGQTGTSIFDPVLCELAYRWFAPAGGSILDPFAGGSVRGIVAAILGHPYTGIDLRPEQVEANGAQAREILRGGPPAAKAHANSKPAKKSRSPEALITDPDVQTPVQWIEDDGVFLKRDDLFDFHGARGSKAKACITILKGAKGATCAGNRLSPMVSRVARVAAGLGIPCRVHCSGAKTLSQQEIDAKSVGAEVVKHKVNYLTALKSKAAKDAADRGWVCVPFGVEHEAYVEACAAQVENLPLDDFKRLVVTVGSGMALAGILRGLERRQSKKPVLGIMVGADPTKRLDEWAPKGWRSQVELRAAPTDYAVPEKDFTRWGIDLDPHYEAKAAKFVKKGDLFWIVAVRSGLESSSTPAPDAGDEEILRPSSSAPVPVWIAGDSSVEIPKLPKESFDLVFSCPPYGDLERYSDDPRDLSTLDLGEFREKYREIILRALERLKPNRFAVFVVGDYRVKSGPRKGFYAKFITETIEAFEADGRTRVYNEAILVTSVGSLAMRINAQFSKYRKLGKTHQNILVFFKGDPAKIPEVLGPVDLPEPVKESES